MLEYTVQENHINSDTQTEVILPNSRKDAVGVSLWVLQPTNDTNGRDVQFGVGLIKACYDNVERY